MPMANKNLNTVARLAMGTAMLTVISGCETRIGQGFSNLVSPLTGAADTATQTAESAPASYIPEANVVAPEYVLPGVPTYVESSQAANVQTFESVYGPPVVDSAAGNFAVSETYAVPSYNDGTVLAQPLAAPSMTVAAPEIASYSQSVTTLPETTMMMPEPSYGVASVAADNLVYGESLTTESDVSAPMEASTMVMIEEAQAPAAPMMAEATTETYSYESAPMMEAEVTVPAAAPMMEPEPVMMSEPMMASDAMMVPEPMMASEPMMETEPMMASEPMMEPEQMMLPASAPAMEQMAIPAAPMPSGFEIISNDEVEAVFSGETMSAPLEPSVFDAPEPASLGGQFQITPEPMPSTGTMDPIRSQAPVMGMTNIEVAALSEMRIEPQPLPEIAMTPVPRPKATMVTSTLAAVDRSPLTAPSPRPRPSVADRSYATLTTPLPQPRPDYKEPVTMATSSGSYVSIGALPAQPSFGAPKISDDAMLSADATDGNGMRDAAPSMDVASVRMPEPKAPPLSTPARKTDTSELSGTSWRLVEIDAAPVSVNAELHFDGSSGFAGGQGPCNSYGGEFVNTGKGRFSMADIFSTEIACSSLDLEKRYIGALENASVYKIAPGFSDLTLIDEGGRELARFKAF